jgi:malic enzyme
VLLQPSASYSFILRTETSDRPGTLGRVTTAIGEEGGDIGAIDIVRVGGGRMLRDLTVAARDEAHADAIVQRVRTVDGVKVLHVTDRTFLVHLGGKIEVHGADMFIGLSAPGIVTESDIAAMASDPIVFALANPIPEIQPEGLVGIARVIATGRSDYPNQINNSLAFPGMFRGALDVQATDINAAMKLAAADAIAGLIGPGELTEESIVPSLFDRRVADTVAQAVRDAAWSTGVARKSNPDA